MDYRHLVAGDPLEDSFPQAWEDLLQKMAGAGGLQKMAGAGGDQNGREAAKARLNAYVMGAQLMQTVRLAERHEELMKAAEAASAAQTAALLDQAAAQERQATAANDHAASLKWATWALVLATVVLIVVTAVSG
jgi:hypothetical protein